MAVKFKCPVCLKLVKAVDEYAGKEGKCLKCMKKIPKPKPGPKENAKNIKGRMII